MEDALKDTIYVLSKDEVLLAVFNKDDKDFIINPKIKETQNTDAILTFQISIDNPKWNIIKDVENIYVVNGKAFSANFDESFNETLTENDEKTVFVTAYERQKLLSRRFVRAWNSTTNLDIIDIFMVVVLSGGDLPLQNDGNLVASLHLPGTSGYVLDALLYGTGWSTGVCDVQGTFDFETDQLDIYENIMKVQELWGGILVFDSVNKIVHHRDETVFLPYTGYEVRYKKNMKNLEKIQNNKIITRLCPLGESSLNIKSVNNGSEWLENFSYTPNIYEGIENNTDITDPEQLKRWGERKLQDLCKPSKDLIVDLVLFHKLEGYELESLELNDIVDVIDYNDIEGDIEQLRVIGFTYNIWDYSDATVELSDITLESTDIFKKSVKATNIVSDGKIDGSKVVLFDKNGQSINETIRIIDRTIVDTKAELLRNEESIEARVEVNETSVDDLNNEVISQKRTVEDLVIDVNGLTNTLAEIGGDNLIRNSVGYFENECWEGTIVTLADTDVMINNQSNSAISLQNGSILQNVMNLKNGTYNISFRFKKRYAASVDSVEINGVASTLTGEGWTMFEQVITVVDNVFTIKFTSDTPDSCLISDLMLIFGQYRAVWSLNKNENKTDTVKIGEGIQVDSTATNTFTRIDSDGNRTFNKITGEVVMETTDDGIYGKNLEIPDAGKTRISGLLLQKIDDQVWLSVL